MAMRRRHPSQIYQFLLEGLLLFVVHVACTPAKSASKGKLPAVFFMGYGILRFAAEFFREPDAHLGILSLGMSMGQWLCVFP
jgi:phosphatidylglycerol:prolipoprotein diacylglycerol transferase